MLIDLHNMNYYEAIRHFVRRYNELLKSGRIEVIEVVHGYGASGKGGVIKRKLQAYLKEHRDYLDFEFNSSSKGINQGCTLVLPKRILPELKDILENDILDFCSNTPKTMEKITGYLYKKYEEKKIKETVRSLTKKGELSEELKKRSVAYVKKRN